MNMAEHKKEIKESMKDFIKQMNLEHGVSIEHAKTILISEAMDSASEIGNDYNLNDTVAHGWDTPSQHTVSLAKMTECQQNLCTIAIYINIMIDIDGDVGCGYEFCTKTKAAVSLIILNLMTLQGEV